MPKNNSKPQREHRKNQAEARAEERSKLLAGDQIERLATRPGQAKRETARLRAEARAWVDAENAKVAAKKASK